MKSEPEVFSIDHLKSAQSSLWDGVRNYQARNFMTQDMKVGDMILFYHSNASPPGIAGLAKVIGGAEPDPTSFDPNSEYYDPKSSPSQPRWFGVRVGFVEKFKHFVSLEELKQTPALKGLLVLKKGQRLSIQPVSKQHFDTICRLGQA